MDAHFSDGGQLLDLENEDVGVEKYVEDVESDRIDVAIWEKKNGLCVVLQEYRLEVLVTGVLCTGMKTRSGETNCDRIYKSS